LLTTFPAILASFSVRENLLCVTGNPETKTLESMLPDILKQLSTSQYKQLKDAFKGAGAAGGKKEEDDDDDVPELVGTFDQA
jgi:hypothetical protein